jgi:hypothetical protein
MAFAYDYNGVIYLPPRDLSYYSLRFLIDDVSDKKNTTKISSKFVGWNVK